MRKISRSIFIVLFLTALVACPFASNIEGTRTYDDCLLILVHGIHSNSGIFTGQKEFGNLKAFLEKSIEEGGLGLQGRVYAYTFNNPDARNDEHARELGGRSYYNPRPEMNGESWLKKDNRIGDGNI